MSHGFLIPYGSSLKLFSMRGESHSNPPSWFLSSYAFISILAKINLCGGDYLDHLLPDISKENIPAILGGDFQLYNEPFPFDLSEG